MATVPPTPAQIDAWMDADVLINMGNVYSPQNGPTWGDRAPTLFIVGYTQNDGTQHFMMMNNDPTLPSSPERVVVEGHIAEYGSVTIRAYSGIVVLPSSPPTAVSVALPAAQQATYNNQANWAPAP